MSSLVSRPFAAASVLVPAILFFGYLWLCHREQESVESKKKESKDISLAEELKQVHEKLSSIRRSRLDTLTEVDLVEEENTSQSETLPSGEYLFDIADIDPQSIVEPETPLSEESVVEVGSVSDEILSEDADMDRTKIKGEPVFSCSDIRYREKSVNSDVVSPVVDTSEPNKKAKISSKSVIETPKRKNIVLREDDSGSDCSVEVLLVKSSDVVESSEVIEILPTVPSVLSALGDPLCSPVDGSPPEGASPLGSRATECYSCSPLKSEAGDSVEGAFKGSSCEWSDLIEQDEREQLQEFKLDSKVLSSKLYGLDLVSESGVGRGLDSGVVSPSEDFLLEKDTFKGRIDKQRLQSGEDAGIGSDPGDGYSEPGCSIVKTDPHYEDNQLLAYHFHIPDFLCGKLIGEKGRFINKLKEDCKCNVILKETNLKKKAPPRRRKDREYGDGSLKVCCLEGTRANIDRCLDLLRERFRGNEEVSLEQVNGNKEKSGNLNLHGGSVSLNLAEGIMHEVFVSSIISGGHVFIQQPCHPTFFALERLDSCLSRCYSGFDCPSLPLPISLNTICVAEVEGCHYRVQVTAQETEEAEEHVVQIKFLDHGGYDTIPVNKLKQIRTDFLTLPFQAIECYLANVCPNDEENVSALVLEEMVRGQVVQARMIGTNEQGVPMVHLYRHTNGQTVMINRELVDRNCAEWLDTTIVKLDSPLNHPSNY